MNDNDKKKLYAALAAPFPDEAVERTDGAVTGKGYSTTGIKYQFVVNRLNDVLGLGGWRAHRQVTVTQLATSSGRKAYEAICDLVLQLGTWVNGEFQVFAEALADGGHISVSEADARKGAYTNALKKGAAMFGCGRQAYEGTLDDDAVPGVDQMAPVSRAAPQQASTQTSRPSSAPQTNGVPPSAPVERARLTAKQLAALWAISKKLGMAPAEFRRSVKEQHGVQPEFLTRPQASALIASMGNGHGEEPAGRVPGMEG
ncbi:MAG: Rad52/Rad22 family DNA repair protein [Myxococcota bacterium]